tara:strand:+ start:1222 stop:1962 length:741 start_codon:yes stop_codon:yes gene_type:complete
MSDKFNLPTEVIELPSKGLLYPEGHPLAEGKVEIKYMTAKEEDILTNQNYIKNGSVIDRLLQSLIVTKFDYNDLLTGDKNAIMIAARILAYGAKYDVTYNGVDQEIDLSTLENLPIDENLYKRGENEFSYTLPHTKNDITFKILTGHDERKIEAELKSLKKISKTASNEVTVRLYRTITSVNGSTEAKDIKEFTSNYFLAKDVREFRKYYKSVNPDVDMDVTVINDEGEEEIVALPIGLSFFWPDL